MALKRKYSVCAWFVLVLGLVSCSQDKEINYVPTPVTGFNVGALDSQRKMQWAQDIEELELGSALTVDLLNNQNLDTNPITVRVQSWCKTGTSSTDTYSDLYFQNKLSIPVLNTLSPQALLSLDESSLTCRLVLTLTDSLSSQRIYDLQNIKIKNSAEFNNLSLLTENTATLFYEDLKEQILPSGEQRLVCQDFSKNPAEPAQTWAALVNLADLDMSTWSSSAQKCRLLIKTPQETFLSSRFTLVFPQKELLIRTELQTFSSPTMELAPRHVISLKVTNPNSFSVTLKIQNKNNNRMMFVPVYSGIGAIGYIGHQRDVPLTWNLRDTSALTSSTENEWFLELAANQEIILDGIFQGNLHCNTELLSNPNKSMLGILSTPYFVGIQYGFDFKIQFQTQLTDESWQTSNLRQGALAELNTAPLPFMGLFYEAARAQFGRYFPHQATTSADFINTIRRDVVYDRCVVR